tara:strand:- start:30672 stop:32342 length:1671 start_codon:yes stop_codon:yes gene_type:complete
MTHKNVYLVGLSYSGKTSVGLLLGQLLDRPVIDIDDEIVKEQSQSVESIFSEYGEAYFRELEKRTLSKISSTPGQIISTGGGIVIDPQNRKIMASTGTIIHLETSPNILLNRMESNNENEVRPLLKTGDPLRALSEIQSSRRRHYSNSDWVVKTDHLEPKEVAKTIIEGLDMVEDRVSSAPPDADRQNQNNPKIISVQTESSDYDVFFGVNILEDIGDFISSKLGKTKCHVIFDSNIREALQDPIISSLDKADLDSDLYVYSGGEENKNLDSAEQIYSWLSEVRAERKDTIVAVGGGVTGDLAGFVAATYARGLKIVHVPTTLLAMVDSSIGGKVAVDLPAGKNLVGAFHQPSLVLSDITCLASLPPKEMVSGWAEVIKTALALDNDLLQSLNQLPSVDSSTMPNGVLLDIIYRTAKIKADVITIDEKEATGLRARLNYGHTLGHAIETAGKYKLLTHGESVALGMVFASNLGVQLGILDSSAKDTHDQIIAKFGLPTTPPQGLDIEDVFNSIQRDKKIVDGKLSWILIDELGHSRQHKDIDPNAYLPLIRRFFAS